VLHSQNGRWRSYSSLVPEMATIHAQFIKSEASSRYRVQVINNRPYGDHALIEITLPGFFMDWRGVEEKLVELLPLSDCRWLGNYRVGPRRVWMLDVDELRRVCPEALHYVQWLSGQGLVKFHPMPTHSMNDESTTVSLHLWPTGGEYWESYAMWQQEMIFLSHKGADKPLVRDFYETLLSLGYHVWLDEDALSAGAELERGLLEGFKKSCAAVFFITEQFRDEGFLATEVNYAIQEKRSKGKRFAIISLVFDNGRGSKGSVPDLLKQFVWKEPKTQLEALRVILRALPIRIIGDPEWNYEARVEGLDRRP
jgi:hypothetical protein